jgi:hypothetical protein
VAGEQVGRLARGDHASEDHAVVARDTDDHREAGGVAVADIDIGRREPQIPLGELTGTIVGSLEGSG